MADPCCELFEHLRERTGRLPPELTVIFGLMVGSIVLLVSLVSTSVLVWDKFLRRSRFEVQADWIVVAADPVLRVAIHNVGDRKDAIRDVRFKERAMPVGRGWTPHGAVLSQLPVTLDGGEASPVFSVHPRHGPWHVFHDGLLCSRIDTLEVENGQGRISTHSLPLLYEAERDVLTNSGERIPKSTP